MTEVTMLCLVLSTQSKHMTLLLGLNLTLTDKKKFFKEVPLDQPNKTGQLLTLLNLAVCKRRDISLYIRTDDGLTNGAANIVKLIQLQQTGKPSGIVWVQFDCVDVGEKTRQDIRHIYVQGVEPTWTPIKPVMSPFVVGRNTTAWVLRKQFPLHPGAVKTIYSSKGDTLAKVVVNFDTKKKQYLISTM